MSQSGIDDFAAVDVRVLAAGMKRAAELGLLVAVHAESDEMTQRLTKERIAASETAVSDYLASRPIAAELDAIRKAIDLAAETGCRLHIVHVSCGSGVAAVAEARRKGVDVSCETCPHYLVLTEDDMIKLGAVAKCAPPLRSADEQRSLWSGLDDINTIGSDHSPSPWTMKERSNFFQVWGGISGCQHLLPLLLDCVGRGQLTDGDITRLTSSGVAERFSLPAKGGIRVGNDADFTLVDLEDETVRAESLLYRHRHSPYVGRRLRGRIRHTFLRGQTIFEDGKVPPRPLGKFVRPQEV
jgi:allantoinase